MLTRIELIPTRRKKETRNSTMEKKNAKLTTGTKRRLFDFTTPVPFCNWIDQPWAPALHIDWRVCSPPLLSSALAYLFEYYTSWNDSLPTWFRVIIFVVAVSGQEKVKTE